MLEQLKFVQGSVAKKEFLPSLTHFVIEEGTVRGYNGTIALCSPIPFEVACKPKAEPLVRAIGNCNATVQLALTPTGRLSVKSGAFKAFIDCTQEETPHVMPSGDMFSIDGEALIKALEVVEPFIGSDASRPWATGVLLDQTSVFATNNVTVVEYWTAIPFPRLINLPRMAVKEMLRVGLAPHSAQADEHSITFHYPNGCWIRSQLYDAAWPDMRKILDKENSATPVDSRLFDGLEAVKHFTDKMGRVYINNGVLSTQKDGLEGASYEIPDMQYEGVFNIEMLSLLNSVATSCDFSQWPKACLWFGERVRGAIIGLRS